MQVTRVPEGIDCAMLADGTIIGVAFSEEDERWYGVKTSSKFRILTIKSGPYTFVYSPPSPPERPWVTHRSSRRGYSERSKQVPSGGRESSGYTRRTTDVIPGRIEDVDKGVIEALIGNEARESKSIEYKQEMPGRADSDAVPFLAGVSSLANASGGDLLLGVKAIKGVPVEAPGIRINDVDAEKLRLEHMLLNGVEPRLPRIDIEEIEVDSGAYVLVVRVPDTWSAPHRVKRNSKFYARNSAGRYELDVGELRTAFAMTEVVSTRIRDFRADRLAKNVGRETPVPTLEGGRMVVHIVPLNVFRATTEIAMSALQAYNNQIRPMDSDGRGYSVLINLDGFVTSVGKLPNESDTYAQMFRNGAVEAASVLERNEDGTVLLPSEAYEKEAANFVSGYLRVTGNLEIEPPYYVFLSFVGIRGCQFAVSRGIQRGSGVRSFARDTMVLPEAVIEDRGEHPINTLRPRFDMVWNAFGFAGSMNYDPQGNWVGQ